MLRRFSVTDKVVVALSGDAAERKQSAGYVLDLAFFFDRVRGVELPARPATLAQLTEGPEGLHQLLSAARPLMTYKASGRGFATTPLADPDPPPCGPRL
jgi:hypothetical protein